MPKTEKKNILTDSEKVEFLNQLKGKGQKPPEDWQLIHSEICNPEEDEVELDSIINKLSAEGVKFAIDIVSNPNENSFLDSGNSETPASSKASSILFGISPARSFAAKIARSAITSKTSSQSSSEMVPKLISTVYGRDLVPWTFAFTPLVVIVNDATWPFRA